MSDKLPPLPPSDSTSLSFNRGDGFYRVGARDFWGQNEVIREELPEYKKCPHYFEETKDGVRCVNKGCGMGLLGRFKVQDGKLFVQGAPVEF